MIRADDEGESAVGLGDAVVEVVVAVSDLGRARAFYEETLGLSVQDTEPEAVRYRCGGGTRFFVYESAANAGTSTATVAGWFVPDLDATVEELAARGARFEHYDQPGLKTDERGVFDNGSGTRAVWLKDPDGNVLAVSQA